MECCASTRMSATAGKKAFTIKVLCCSALCLPVALCAQNPAYLPDRLGPTMKADPLSFHQKFDYRLHQMVGFRAYGGAVTGAAITQAMDRPHEWGQGVQGYATRFASGIGTNLSRQAFAMGLEEALHEDPRYFPSEEKGFGHRMKSVLLQTVVARTDSGKATFAWARMGSAFAAGELTGVWEPPSISGPGHGLERGAFILGGDLAYNFFQEFFPFVRPKAFRHKNADTTDTAH